MAVNGKGEAVTKSYGCMTIILSYLEPDELITLQALNRWFYKKAISRVQTRISITKMNLYYPISFGRGPSRVLHVQPHKSEREWSLQDIQGYKWPVLQMARVSQIGSDLFITGGEMPGNIKSCTKLFLQTSNNVWTIQWRTRIRFSRMQHAATVQEKRYLILTGGDKAQL